MNFLTPETMKLLGSTKNKINKDKNGENVPDLEITEVILVQCNNVNNDYQQDSKTFDSEYDEIEVWFTYQNSRPLEIEDRIIMI